VLARSKWKNCDNLNRVRREASRHFRSEEIDFLKDKINEFNEFKMVYQPKNNLVKNGNGDLLAGSQHHCAQVEGLLSCH
jgi:hypothetical protein